MDFKELKLIGELTDAIKDTGYTTPTQIQKEAIPHILNGKDLLGLAQTGTGKTAAFVLPILQLILNNSKSIEVGKPRVLILAPTRELVTQIGKSIETYAKHTQIKHLALYGGVGVEINLEKLKEPIEIIVATPRKLNDLLEEKIISLKSLDFFVLDEVDKMLDAGTIFDLKKIIKILPRKRQSLFFSATLPEEVSDLVDDLLTKPVKIDVENQRINIDKIEQNVMFVKTEHKFKLLLEILKKKEVKSAIIFANSKDSADNLVRFLRNNGILSEALHSQKSQTHRAKVVGNIKSRKIKFLIATDLASRGLDIDNITHVINFELPTNAQGYVHRIGRTARAGNSGIAYSLCAPDEKNFLNNVEKFTGVKINVLTHSYHSEFAKNATGKDAKPKSKKKKSNIKKKFAVKTIFKVGTKVKKK